MSTLHELCRQRRWFDAVDYASRITTTSELTEINQELHFTTSDTFSRTSLHLAVAYDAPLELIQRIISLGNLDPDSPSVCSVSDCDDWLPLHLCAAHNDSVEITRLLIREFPAALITPCGNPNPSDPQYNLIPHLLCSLHGGSADLIFLLQTATTHCEQNNREELAKLIYAPLASFRL
jgi:hypothetical protein